MRNAFYTERESRAQHNGEGEGGDGREEGEGRRPGRRRLGWRTTAQEVGGGGVARWRGVCLFPPPPAPLPFKRHQTHVGGRGTAEAAPALAGARACFPYSDTPVQRPTKSHNDGVAGRHQNLPCATCTGEAGRDTAGGDIPHVCPLG